MARLTAIASSPAWRVRRLRGQRRSAWASVPAPGSPAILNKGSSAWSMRRLPIFSSGWATTCTPTRKPRKRSRMNIAGNETSRACSASFARYRSSPSGTITISVTTTVTANIPTRNNRSLFSNDIGRIPRTGSRTIPACISNIRTPESTSSFSMAVTTDPRMPRRMAPRRVSSARRKRNGSRNGCWPAARLSRSWPAEVAGPWRTDPRVTPGPHFAPSAMRSSTSSATSASREWSAYRATAMSVN